MLGGLGLLLAGHEDGPAAGVGAAEGATTSPRPVGRGARRSAAEAPAGADFFEKEQHRQEVRLWEERLEQARLTLDSYAQATRYPPGSRPLRENPDQLYPSSPEHTQPLDEEDPASRVVLRLAQERVFVAGDQTVDLWVRCEDPQGGSVPCEVTSARVSEAQSPEGAQGPEPVPLAFADEGGPGDVQAGDGILSARFQPSREGFALHEEPLHVALEVKSGPTRGRAFFALTYTGPVPAAFTGEVREALEHGSLVLRLPVQVRTPGRYVVDARVDDARGQPFAYLSFNEELGAGRQDVVLTVFGRLVRDEQPAFPLRLRDVDGFLLCEDSEPDRALMLPLRGLVHTTRSYPLTAFSDAEWQSEERQRHLDEFSRDVQQAEDHLEGIARAP